MTDYIKLEKTPKENLEILKNFYVNVWGEYKEYVENDEVLCQIFQQEKFSLRVRAIILNKFYSAGMFDIELESFVKKFVGKESDLSQEKIGKITYRLLRKLISMESKYLHWYREINDKSNAVPIYDKNVRMALKKGYGLQVKVKSYEDLEATVNKFLNKYLKDCDRQIDLCNFVTQFDDLKRISIYRLVDKFLWLQYKIVQTNNIIPTQVRKNFESLRDLKEKI